MSAHTSTKPPTNLAELTWDNFCHVKGRGYTKNSRIYVYVKPTDSDIGKTFPLAITNAEIGYLFVKGSEHCDGWEIPEKNAAIGIYLGMKNVIKGQTKPAMLFATPTKGGNYFIYSSDSGAISWFGGGDDEPAEQSGIRVNELFISNPENTTYISKLFGDRLKELSSLIEFKK